MIRARAATLADIERICALYPRTGLSAIDPEGMRRFWFSHPFRAEFEGVPIGWVLEDGPELVGTFSNIHMMYEYDGEPIKAGIAALWGVESEHRNSSLMLAMSYLTQKKVDVCINGSASAVASKVMTALKANRIPSEDYDLSYLWIMRRRAFARAVLKKKNVPAPSLLAPFAGLGLRVLDVARRLPPRMPAGARRLADFGPEFDALWERLRKGPVRLRAVRTATALKWRFGNEMKKAVIAVVGLERSGSLRGYVVLREQLRAQLGLRQYVIADLQAVDDSPETVRELVHAAVVVTRQDGLDALEWQGRDRSKRQAALAQRPRTYRYPVWQLYYRAVRSELAPMLAKSDAWDFSPFDAF